MEPGPIFTIYISSTVPVNFLQTTITFHTIQLTLCFQQTGEIDNLIVRWGKVLSLCCAGFQLLATPLSRLLPPTGLITLVSYEGKNLLLYSSYLPLGVLQRSSTLNLSASSLFLAPLTRRLRTASQ